MSQFVKGITHSEKYLQQKLTKEFSRVRRGFGFKVQLGSVVFAEHLLVFSLFNTVIVLHGFKWAKSVSVN